LLQLVQSPSWQQIFQTNFTDWEKLANFLELDAEQRKCILTKPKFRLNLPFRLAAKIPKKTLEDPILKQFLPTVYESIVISDFVQDPVGDCAARQSSKLLRKYHGRVLLICTSSCVMHCRFCFRQHFEYPIREKAFDHELTLIGQDPSIREVILSGGDPLSLSNALLGDLLKKLEAIPHVRRVRFHTRFPIGIPERIDEGFLKILGSSSLRIWFLLHVNHPRELDKDIFAALTSLQKIGVSILNQSVLLRGVNDDVETLVELCELLVDHHIFPYYLYQLDRVQGAAHYEVLEEEGKALMRALSARLPGYAVPKYAKEVAGKSAKTMLNFST
jgi:EF-P beta-lysylation protein EpmB